MCGCWVTGLTQSYRPGPVYLISLILRSSPASSSALCHDKEDPWEDTINIDDTVTTLQTQCRKLIVTITMGLEIRVYLNTKTQLQTM
ncbi:hypothetical protein RRG08_014258 [Elysia crispata]|uniref:Uncharacterized protein n=1 Tax=Elysia crispata TaxID=231223 RepID=A0AAE1B8H7_9GAST|nr:hypothetical protein RRG08_014258 [Elysia crispata]